MEFLPTPWKKKVDKEYTICRETCPSWLKFKGLVHPNILLAVAIYHLLCLGFDEWAATYRANYAN